MRSLNRPCQQRQPPSARLLLLSPPRAHRRPVPPGACAPRLPPSPVSRRIPARPCAVDVRLAHPRSIESRRVPFCRPALVVLRSPSGPPGASSHALYEHKKGARKAVAARASRPCTPHPLTRARMSVVMAVNARGVAIPALPPRRSPPRVRIPAHPPRVRIPAHPHAHR
ncbi:hypothetical protein B0H15DRAFT_955754 [Mycena belliarum]|uniref:Uncharacterized protein n=1 Tax=Mycena belliarum TaxID=1033014 RepID=A0AAD6XFV0_9AGAR|nr:hypothetical protein B0H15DRAFT_955754 [Mycena belliae]